MHVNGRRPGSDRPFIAIAPRTEDRAAGCYGDTYYAQAQLVEAIKKAGGIPVILGGPCDPAALEDIVRTFDGFVMPGGCDVSPALYGQEREQACGTTSVRRDSFEPLLIRAVLEADKPLLAICRGTQELNAVLGGTLWQDIPSHPEAVPHHDLHPIEHARRDDPEGRVGHSVRVAQGTLLARVLGAAPHDLHVNTLHHQAIREVAPGLEVNAWAPDGCIEGVELPGRRFVLGVQWHPELMWHLDDASMRFFEALVHAAEEARQGANARG